MRLISSKAPMKVAYWQWPGVGPINSHGSHGVVRDQVPPYSTLVFLAFCMSAQGIW